VFHHHDGVRAFGERCAGHDFSRFSRSDVAGKYLAGTNLADDPEAAWNIGGADCEAIPHGTVEGREVAIGYDILGDDAISEGAIGACVKGGGFDRGQFHSRMHFAQNDVACLSERESRHEFSLAFYGAACGRNPASSTAERVWPNWWPGWGKLVPPQPKGR
jgi:hypothetical protein